MNKTEKTYKTAVVVEAEVAIRINPNLNTNALVEEFSECMYAVDSIEELVEFASACITKGEPSFIEGIGPVAYDYGQEWEEDVVIHFTIRTDVSTEIVD